MIEKHWSTADVAERLSIHPETIRRAVAAGELKAVRFGRTLRFSESEIERWLERNRIPGRRP